ncbi:MAG: VOC family protein [Tissierellales bacterium]
MSSTAKPYGPIMQIAYVVDDLHAAIDYWTEVMGVGPFLILDNLVFENGYYLSKPLDLNMTAAMSFSAGLQIELIYQHDNTPSIFTERRSKEGSIHHLAAFTEDLDASIAWLEARGGENLQGADVPGGSRVAYVDMGSAGILELAQLQPEVHQLFEMVRSTAAQWDGQQKILSLPG